MRRSKEWLLAGLLLGLCGCASAPQRAADGQAWQEDWTMVGTAVGIEETALLTPLENSEALAADGLYYATWVDGGCVPYENSDGDTVDLYDAQLYLLTSEAMSEESAADSCETWLAAARENYQVEQEETVTCNGQPYTWLTYRCIGEDNPYDRGVSAFGICGTTAVCAELTCREDYSGDLAAMLTDFLEGCHYRAE